MTDWIASPTGLATGAGTIASPRDLASLVTTGTPVVPGDQIWLRVGSHTPLTAGETGTTYLNGTAGVAGKGCYPLKLNGTATNPIVIRNYPGEAARINGAFHATLGNCSYITIRGIEVAPTPTTRSFAAQDNVDYPAIYITATGIKIYNCYLHDCEGIYPMEAAGFEMDGCVVGWNGFYSSDLAVNRNYNLYAHNDSGGTVGIYRNVFLYSFASTSSSNPYNLHFYGVLADVKDYDIRYNVTIHGTNLIGNSNEVNTGNYFRDNYCMGSRARLLAQITTTNANGSEITASDNIFWDTVGVYPITVIGYKNASVSGNTSINSSGGTKEVARYAPNSVPGTVSWDGNTYYGNPNAGFYYISTDYSFANWKSLTGFDAASTANLSLPTANTVALIAATYGKRGFVVVMNYLGSDSVSIDLTSLGLTDGARCRYSNCLNMDEYIDFTYDASSPTLTISMLAASWSLRSPTGYDSPVSWPTEPFPSYGAFLVEQLDEGDPLTIKARDITLTVPMR